MADCKTCDGANVVMCPHCEKEIHVCPIFPPPQELTPEVGGEKEVRCPECGKSLVIAEELVVIYEAYADKPRKALRYDN